MISLWQVHTHGFIRRENLWGDSIALLFGIRTNLFWLSKYSGDILVKKSRENKLEFEEVSRDETFNF